jgi:hypothetical protein
MPLINIIGMTACNKSFFAGSAFVPSEKILDFIWLFNTIKKIYDTYNLAYPKTFVTDGDKHMAKTLQRVFPSVNHILCIWHVNRNIQTKLISVIKRQYDNSEDTDLQAYIDEK